MKLLNKKGMEPISVVILIAIILGGLFLVNSKIDLKGAIFSIEGTTSEVQVVAKFTQGYLECAPGPAKPFGPGSIPQSANGIEIRPTDFGDISDMQVVVNYPSAGNIGIADEDYIIYKECKISDNSCGEWLKHSLGSSYSAGTYDLPIITRDKYYVVGYYDLCSSYVDLLKGGCNKDIGFNIIWGWTYGVRPLSGATYSVVYHPYSLWSTDPIQGTKHLSDTCANPVSQTLSTEKELVVSSTYKDLLPEQTFSSTKKSLIPGERWNYISEPILVLAEVETYNGQQASCKNNVMYGYSEILTTQGKYLIEDLTKNLGGVTCCNGDVRVEEFCENHQWVSEAECSLINPCPYSDWIRDTETTVYKQTCQNGKCVKETKTVECTSDTQCASTETCLNFVCVTTVVPPGPECICGDGKCCAGEICPADCKTCSTDEDCNDNNPLTTDTCTDGVCIYRGGGNGSQTCLTKDKLKTITDESIRDSQCNFDNECTCGNCADLDYLDSVVEGTKAKATELFSFDKDGLCYAESKFDICGALEPINFIKVKCGGLYVLIVAIVIILLFASIMGGKK